MAGKLHFQPMDTVVPTEHRDSILDAAQRAGIPLHAACGGQGKCGKCKVHVSHSQRVSPPTDTERRCLSPEEIDGGIRLACMAHPLADADLVVTPASPAGEQQAVILEWSGENRAVCSPCVRRYRVALPPPDLAHRTDDLARLRQALTARYPALESVLEIDPHALRALPDALRKNNWDVSAAILYDKRIIAVTGAEDDGAYGVALDIGTTTVAAYLCSLTTGAVLQTASCLNPQIRYGDDVLSRVAHCQNDPGGLRQLRDCLLAELGTLYRRLATAQGISLDHILETVVAANTVMVHIALGITPEYIGKAPFIPAATEAMELTAQQFGLESLPGGNVHILPSISGFVGADTTAALIAAAPHRREGTVLLLDIGTNSEICLCRGGEIYATSCATGPALEGAQIHCGMRASPGAIESVRVDRGTLEPTVGIIGGKTVPEGICGSGIVDAVAQMAECGIVDADGTFAKQAVSPRIHRREKGGWEYVLYAAEQGAHGDVAVTQKDVRAVQLSKAALYTGAGMLLERCGAASVDRVILTGGFGNYMDAENALLLGMFPDCRLSDVEAVGNAAGLGAQMALVSADKRAEAARVAAAVTFVETAADPGYPARFMDAIPIPHARDRFTKNRPSVWPCGGNDTRATASAVLRLGERAFADASVMDRALTLNMEANGSPCRVYPLVQKLEAAALGARLQRVGEGYAFVERPCSSLDQVPAVGRIAQHPWIQNTLDCIAAHRGERQMLEVCGPFSLLCALVDPMRLYACYPGEAQRLSALLLSLADALGAYVAEALRAGVTLVSFADPEGNLELVGEAFYRALCGPANRRFLAGLRGDLAGALVHVCGKTATSLLKAGMSTAGALRLPEGRDYVPLLFDLAAQPNIRYVGNGCVHGGAPPVVTLLEFEESGERI